MVVVRWIEQFIEQGKYKWTRRDMCKLTMCSGGWTRWWTLAFRPRTYVDGSTGW